ncbi:MULTISPECIES: S9 family peptidase [Anaerolinea]|uniref:alpha/beta hydrolase family protein n=1 Tax=Anaerolinea TaxID=233189 RepID=UPI0026110CCD|nr:prolyl oligopeptidase family serine peptidase [Anaerolinea thermophila]
MFRIESLLSARLFVSPQVVGNRLYFISNLSGHLSLYAMDHGGSVPEPLLPPDLVLHNPHLMGGYPFYVFEDLGKILVMMDHEGDENYQPMVIPMEGGYPEPFFKDVLGNCRVHLVDCDARSHVVYFSAESRETDTQMTYRASLANGSIEKIAESPFGVYPLCHTEAHERVVLMDGYTEGDGVLYLWEKDIPEKRLILGKPLEQRQPGEEVPLNGIRSGVFVNDGQGLLLACAVFNDRYGPAYLDLNQPGRLQEMKVEGIAHSGDGEMVGIQSLKEGLYLVEYNIDGCSWLYEATADFSTMTLHLMRPIVGHHPPFVAGMLASYLYDEASDRYAISYSTATSPTQLYTIEGADRQTIVQHTRERVLGIPSAWLSPGEDASYTSFDGTRISARLYLPSPHLGYAGPRPLVYYIHGGPQSQERPDFAWFSMPLIQFLTLNGFAVFVPNVRGSTGYGLAYTKQVDRDWGGRDRLDHVHALKVLANDPRLDVSRAGVVGRSYGGYMTLTLAARHPELWSAAVDMFGPFDLLTFLERIPPTWKPYFKLVLGDPVEDREFLVERSPKTYIDQLACPLLVIQGKNDPRVVERESRDLVEYLRRQGKSVEYLMFENEGHDVLKYENRVRCYNAITDFFKRTLKP